MASSLVGCTSWMLWHQPFHCYPRARWMYPCGEVLPSSSLSLVKQMFAFVSRGTGNESRLIWCSWVSARSPIPTWACHSRVGEVGELGSALYLDSTPSFISMLRLAGAVPVIILVPVNHVSFVRLDGRASPRLMSCAVPRPNLCLQLPGRIARVVQKSTVLKSPWNMNTAAVKMVTEKGIDRPEKVESREMATGKTSTVYTIGYHSMCFATVVKYNSICRSFVSMFVP